MPKSIDQYTNEPNDILQKYKIYYKLQKKQSVIIKRT